MKQGGSHLKGGEHERAIGRKLSLWLSNGEHNDLFTRNVLSGGAYTASYQRHGKGKGIPGDLAAAHPLAYSFLQMFLVECKHWRDIQADAILWGGKGELLRVISKTEQQAAESRRFAMLIARQNFRPDLLFLPHFVGQRCCNDSLIHHSLWSGRVYACTLDSFLKHDATEFTARAQRVWAIHRKLK